MYPSILVPLDGSAFAEHALPIARGIALRAGAALQLVYVHVPFSVRYVDGRAILDEPLEARLKEQERAYLDQVVKRLAMGPDVPVNSIVLDGKVGQVAKAINEHATATGVDWVVMATHGRGPFSRFWLGSVADKLVRRAEKPILLVRPPESPEKVPDLSQEQIFRHVLIPLDGSALAEQVLGHAVVLSTLMQADYTLLRVIDPLIPTSYPPTKYSFSVDQQRREQLQAEAQAYLDRVAERLRAQSLEVQTKVVTHHHPAVAILEEAEKHGFDLIGMETHGWGGLTRLLIGSVADKVLRGASIPVLLHRPHSEPSS